MTFTITIGSWIFPCLLFAAGLAAMVVYHFKERDDWDGFGWAVSSLGLIAAGLILGIGIELGKRLG
jgi:uncharacterized membrane protein